MSDISLIWTVSALVPETSAEQVGYCIRGPAVSLLEYAARDGLQHITAEAWSGVLAHVGQDRKAHYDQFQALSEHNPIYDKNTIPKRCAALGN